MLWDKGQFALTLGTHCVTRAVVQDKPGKGLLRFYSFPPDQHVIGANALMAGRSLDWFLDTFCSASDDREALFSEYDAYVAEAVPGAKGISFLPYLGGQISPIINRQVRASFHGLSLHHSRFDMYQAVLEGASFAIADSFHQVVDWVGLPNVVSVTGSGASSEVWVQLLANILNQPLSLTDNASEGRGAAIFASVATGRHVSLRIAVNECVHISKVVTPQDDLVGVYATLFDQWRALDR